MNRERGWTRKTGVRRRRIAARALAATGAVAVALFAFANAETGSGEASRSSMDAGLLSVDTGFLAAEAVATTPSAIRPGFGAHAGPGTMPATLPGSYPGASQEGRPLPAHEFYFTRMAYSGGGMGYRRRRQPWATDYPKSDRQFLTVLERLTGLDLFLEEHPRLLTDEHLTRFPFLYAVEVGGMSMNPEEAAALREFLLRGGFLVVDDFWGTWEGENFNNEMQKVFPELPIVDVPLDHDIFHNFYDIEEIIQVPNVGNGTSGRRTHEQDGYDPYVKGIFDEEGRLMVIINWNTDLGDAWEWAENPYYPLKYSTFAFQMGVNFIIYAMSH